MALVQQTVGEEDIGSCTIYGNIMRIDRLPYIKNELILVHLRMTEQDAFVGKIIRIIRSPTTPEPKFIAISHLWRNSDVTDRVDSPDKLSWTLVHDESATLPLNQCLAALCGDSETGEIVIWMDFICLPQSTSFDDKPELFLSMSSVYGSSERCVMVPICDSSALGNWDGVFESLKAGVVEAERSTRCEDWLLISASENPVCDSSFAVNIKNIVDIVRKSYVSKEGWRGMGHVPYKFMRDCILQLQLANIILQSEYFFRVWTFQEIILPEELYISFGSYSYGRSNVVDADAFISLTNMAIATFFNIDKSVSSAHENSAPYKAYKAVGHILILSILRALKLFEYGRSVGRTAKLEVSRKQLSARYIEDVLRIFSSTPRRCKYPTDFVFGLLGMIPIEMKRDDKGADIVVRRFMAEISRKTRRVWVSGGFVKLKSPVGNWWASSVPKDVRDSTFLNGSKPIADFEPEKKLGETFGNVRRGINMEITSNFSLVVGEPEVVNGEKTYRLKHIVCAEHRLSDNVQTKMEQQSLDVTELTTFLHAMIMRFGKGDEPFTALLKEILGLKTETDTDSHFRQELVRYLTSIDQNETADSYLIGGTAPVNMLVTESDLNTLVGTTSNGPTLRVAIDLVCGCKFGCPDNIFKSLMKNRYTKITNLLNLSAIQRRDERLIICEVKMGVKTDFLAKLLPDPDKPTHKLSLESKDGNEDDGHSSFAVDQFKRKIRGIKLYVEIRGFLVSLRDEASGPLKPHLGYIELIERGHRVYAARSSQYEYSQYQPLGLFVFEDDVESQKFIEKSREEAKQELKADGNGDQKENAGSKNESAPPLVSAKPVDEPKAAA
ncbi:hypothetical protein HK100_005833 [Physocladia obscura]|uniref:Heterokaryon incompatibility domain-containing protein n=1 Tax=Physocladia obscura TaxID=109957 RepID=A0AAD5XD03_9FUNG|nr:hypothetical protein HK100_005833 [Physocladia obscura]